MDERLVSYVYCFNVLQDYFECHEYGESLWLDSGRPHVLKGLIQAAVCIYHLEGGNVRGGWRMWQRARAYLVEYMEEANPADAADVVDAVDATQTASVHTRCDDAACVDARRDYEGIQLAQLVADMDAMWRHVPQDWRTLIVARSRMESLDLPTVKITFTNGTLRMWEETLEDWTLTPLEDR